MRSTRRLLACLAAWLWLGVPFGAGVAWGQANYQGLWWNPPAEAGWGINFAHQGDVIFATWFTYDKAGEPWWLIAELRKTAAGSYAGNVATVTGPAFNAQPFDPGKVAETAVGTLAVTFASATQGSLTYTVNGVTQTKTISKQVFGADPTCVWGQQANLAAATNYQDLWWNPAEAGWGVNFTHQGDVIFATWFTYDGAGKPWWLIAELRQTGAGVYGGKVSTVKGPAFDAVPFDAGKVVETVVGEATVSFADGNHGSFAYTVNGTTQAKAVTRQVFAAPGTVCSAAPTQPPLSAAEKRKDAARFLRQATFGAPREAIDALVAQGYEAWLAEQFAKPMVSHVATSSRLTPTFDADRQDWRSSIASLWKQYFEGEDQLRQRVGRRAVADLRRYRLATTRGVESRVRRAGVPRRPESRRVRQLPRPVEGRDAEPRDGRIPQHEGSAKADPVGADAAGRELRARGDAALLRRPRDAQRGRHACNSAPTASRSRRSTRTRQGLRQGAVGLDARRQTSRSPWIWIQTTLLDRRHSRDDRDASSYCEHGPTRWSRGSRTTRRGTDSRAHRRARARPGAKQLLVYTGRAGTARCPPASRPRRISRTCIDNLFYHPNVGPFIGRQLIQRLVTSNPSPAYVARVARKFNDNGSGVRGDMKAVVRAILLDDEARNLTMASAADVRQADRAGHPLRAVSTGRSRAARQPATTSVRPLAHRTDLARTRCAAPSVFNFYRPEYAPAGPLAQAGLVGPRVRDHRRRRSTRRLRQFQPSGFIRRLPTTYLRCRQRHDSIAPDSRVLPGPRRQPDAAGRRTGPRALRGCLDSDRQGADRADGRQGQLSTGATFWGFEYAHERLYVALWLIINSPDYLVQK